MKLLFLAQIWPEHRSSAAGVRTFSLVHAALRAGWQVSFAATTKPNAYTEELEKLGVSTERLASTGELPAFQPDVVLFDRFMTEEQFGWRVREAWPEAVRVLDTIDLHFLRRARASGAMDDTVHRELASLFRSDLSLVISEFEHDFLLRKYQFPAPLLAYVPFFYEEASPGRDFLDRKDFVFIGNYRHPPNHDAALDLAKEIWPALRALLPTAELHLYGAYAPREISALDNPKEGIRFCGQAPNQYDTLAKYRVNLAPLRFGAGLKGKIADGWSVGTPCVATEMAAEGFRPAEEWGGVVALDKSHFVREAAHLYQDAAFWNRASAHSAVLLRDLFSKEREEKKFIELLRGAHRDRDMRREANFIGSMLWHHTLQSSKYFSKWVEEKNKRDYR